VGLIVPVLFRERLERGKDETVEGQVSDLPLRQGEK
jgi:hypothetical protein